MLNKSLVTKSDVIVYDLEDSVPPSAADKNGARDRLARFIGVGIGIVLGTILNVYNMRKYPALVKYWRGFPPPEERLYGAMIGGPALVVGSLWLGWTGQYPDSCPWYVPGLSVIIIGFSICSIFMAFLVSNVCSLSPTNC